MAQPHYAIKYLGSFKADKGVNYTSASLLDTFPTATVVKIKTAGVSVSVNGHPMFLTSFDDENHIVTGQNYTFDRDCILAVGVYVAVS